jgi:hypothetical protein
MPLGKFDCLEPNFLQPVFSGLNHRVIHLGVIQTSAEVFVQPLDAGCCSVDDANQFSTEFRRAVFEQALFCFFSGKPGGVPIRFLRRFQARYFAKVGSDGKLWLGGSGSSTPRVSCRNCGISFAPEVAREGYVFHPAMNASLFKSLEGSGLGVREARFSAAFGENPTSAAGLYQQEFNAASANAVTNSGDLLPSFRKPGRWQELGGWINTHGSRVRDAIRFWLEQTLVRRGESCLHPSTYLCQRGCLGDSYVTRDLCMVGGILGQLVLPSL